MILNFFCDTCVKDSKILIAPKEKMQRYYACQVCNGALKRVMNGPTTNSVQIIDNGQMEKAVEYDEKKVIEIKDASRKMKLGKKLK